MQTHFTSKIDPWKLATTGGWLEGEAPLEWMPRLVSLLSSAEGVARIVIESGVDEQGVRFLKGHIAASVMPVCQRCMEPMLLPLEVNFQLGLVHCESQSPHLPAPYEPLVVPDDGLVVAELVEDELILALPLVAMHNDVRRCKALGFALPDQDEAPAEEKENPFAVLSTLWKDSKNQE